MDNFPYHMKLFGLMRSYWITLVKKIPIWEQNVMMRAGLEKKPHIPAKMKGKSEKKKERWSCIEILFFPFLNSLENMIVIVLNVLTI